jgi:predicted enzyme related to lactoylglutathione lyase
VRAARVEVDATIGDGQFVVLTPADGGLTVGFQRVPEAKAGKNRLHLDLVVEDLEAATAEVEGLGGRWLEPGETRELEGFQWRRMADPEGNEFDIDVLPPG